MSYEIQLTDDAISDIKSSKKRVIKKYYLKLTNYLMNLGNTQPLEQVSPKNLIIIKFQHGLDEFLINID